MSDVADASPASTRTAEGRIEFAVAGVPGAPSQPFSYVNREKGTIRISWEAPKDDGGSPITKYVAKEVRSGRSISCRTTVCDFPGLQDATKYAFRVAAVNKVGTSAFSDQSKTAYADTPPGRVRSISMLSRGDHTITVGWKKPDSTTEIEEYLLTWLGNSVSLDGSTTSFVVPNLDNNRKYFFSVEARNSVGWSAVRQSEPFQSIGTPLAPTGLQVVDLQAGEQVTDVRATWSPTLPEGEAPTLYTVSYSVAGKAPAAVPGCSRIQSTACTHGGRTYDGSIYSYSVRAHNALNSSPASSAVNFEAVGKPRSWGAWQAFPTGSDNQARVTATAPDSRGKTSRAAILVGGQVVWEADVSEGVAINEVVSTPSNAMEYPVQLRMCNENAPTGCTVSADAKSIQTYGPLRTEHLNPVSAQVNGLQVTWTISGTSNGDAALLGVRTDNGAEEVIALDSRGSFSVTKAVTVSDYNTRTEIRVRLFDDAPTGRGEAQVSGQATTGNPPPPTVSIYKQRACNDGDSDTTNDCSNLGMLGCTNNRCGFMGINVTGARVHFGCQVTKSTANQNMWAYEGNMDNGETITDWVFDAGYIEVTCEAGQGGPNYFSVTAALNW
ncbi:fibronectin type III domain-containing protein [Nocardioides piscis]|nr:fibronectin type III domain-containing protein [Nocardioides piscis]